MPKNQTKWFEMHGEGDGFKEVISELPRDMLVARRHRRAHILRSLGWNCGGGGVVDEDGEDGEDEGNQDEDEDLHGGDLRVQVFHGRGE